MLLSCLTSDLEQQVGASILLYTTKTCPCEYAEDFVALQVLAAAMALRCAGFRWNQELPTAEEDVQILEPTEIAAAADAGENEEEMCRIQSENTTNFIVSLNFGLPCECDTIWLSKSPGSCVGMRICFVSTSSIIASRIVSSQNGP